MHSSDYEDVSMTLKDKQATDTHMKRMTFYVVYILQTLLIENLWTTGDSTRGQKHRPPVNTLVCVELPAFVKLHSEKVQLLFGDKRQEIKPRLTPPPLCFMSASAGSGALSSPGGSLPGP